ncbi:MAG: 16S rRNA (cytosine(1402)-N(4))-methyltransferase RsmH [Clostridia bacterium]
MATEFKHISVLLEECIDGLMIKPDGIYVDGTLGGGGHSNEILKRLTTGRLVAIDKDEEAIIHSSERLKDYKDKITYIQDDFKNIEEILESLKINQIDGALIDLGVSSYQIDNGERGFSYMQDAPLDMRMNQSQYLTAFNVVNEYSEGELIKIITNYGDERFAKNIAANIVREREKQSIRTTGQLSNIVEHSIPTAFRWKYGNPCKRTFQAIRIEVNDELGNLDKAVNSFVEHLKSKGRMCVITFHSEEDRIVKRALKELATGCTCDKSLPVCVCGRKEKIKFVVNKAVLPTEDEQTANPRSKSAKLRIIEKI